MDVSGVGAGHQASSPLVVAATQQQVSSPSAQQTVEEDSVEISAEAKSHSAHSHEGE